MQNANRNHRWIDSIISQQKIDTHSQLSSFKYSLIEILDAGVSHSFPYVLRTFIFAKKNVKISKNCRENKNLFIYCRAKSSFYTIRVDCLMACWCCLFSFISSFVSCTKMKLKYMCAYRRTAFFSFALHFCFFYYIRSDNYKILMCIHS